MIDPKEASNLTAASQETVRTMARLQSDLDLAKAAQKRYIAALEHIAAHPPTTQASMTVADIVEAYNHNISVAREAFKESS